MRSLAAISLTFALFFLYRNGVAQPGKIDSLRKVLPTLGDTARQDCLHELGVQYIFKADRDSAIYFANLVYDESKRINYIHGLALSCTLNAAIANHFYNDYSQMERWAREAVKWFDKTGNKNLVPIPYWQLCIALGRECKYTEALINGRLCYNWAKQLKDYDWQASALEAMTDSYRQTGEYDKLLEVQSEMVKHERMSGDTSQYTFHELWVMGLMYRLLEEYSTALPLWRKLFFIERLDPKEFLSKWGAWNLTDYTDLLILADEPDSALYYSNVFDSAKAEIKNLRYFLTSKGEYFLFLKNYSAALPYFLEALIYHRQLNDLMQVKRVLLDIAKTYQALENADSAIAYTRQGLSIAIPANSKPDIRDGYNILSAVYDQLGRIDSANIYFRKYISARDAVLNDQTKGRFVAYNYEQKIASLDKQKLVQRQQLQKERNNRNILIAALIVGLVLAMFLIRNVQLKRRKDQLQHLMAEANTQLENRRKEQQLAEIQQQKTELEMQALRAQMNPHFIFNSLSSINMFILENNKLQASEYLSKFSKLMRLILQNSQEAFIPLERELDALQLYLELESLRFDKKFEYNVIVDDKVDTTVLRVPPLIIQPYAENAIWHGLMHKKKKGHLEIEVYEQEDVLICKITDDGVGRAGAKHLKRESPTKHKSMGIKITESRIAMTQVNDSPKSVEIRDLVYPDGSAAGTEVILKIPINPTGDDTRQLNNR
jgi:tetratricopeptide (TPR) repeat protein